MTATKARHPSLEERESRGEKAREKVPVSRHKGWTPASDRPDPIALHRAAGLDPGTGPGACSARDA